MTASNNDEHFLCLRASPAKMDKYWAEGWRHFGVIFVRYRTSSHGGKPYTVLPLRVELDRFHLTRSQKRVLAKNRDINVIVRPSFINKEKQELFEKHRVRFDDNVPDSLFNFLSPNPAEIPCPNLELCVYLNGRLLGVTFLDIGEVSTSAIYAIFDPTETRRSLGILMILHSIAFSRERNCRYYYPGYAYREPFAYDYKKRLGALEYLDWNNGWRPYPPSAETSIDGPSLTGKSPPR